MIELPESYTISKQINQILKGKFISYIEILHTPHKFAFFNGEQDQYEQLLEGQTIEGAVCHGGMIEMDTGDSMITFADGAYPRYYEDKKKFPKNHQLAIYFDDETALFVTTRMYGFINIFPKGECTEKYYLSSSSKPNPLTAEFTYPYFEQLYTKEEKKLSVKAFLATKQRIPGLGNGVLQDILWDAGIDPRFEMSQMTQEDMHRLYASVRNVLREMCESGGRDTETDLMGEKGKYMTKLCKNTLYEPCMRCGYEIHKANYMGGTVYFCEHCQRKDCQDDHDLRVGDAPNH